MRKPGDDPLHALVVWSALAVLAVVLGLGGRRLYRRWAAGRPVPPAGGSAAPRKDDGIDRPPSLIPPLALSGARPSGRPGKNLKRKQPAAVPMPPIRPDKE